MERLKISIDIALYITIAILALLFLRECGLNSELREESARHSQNLQALKDTVKHVVDRVGDKQAERLTLIATAEELKTYNLQLFEELQKQRGQVMQLISTTAIIRSQVNGIKTSLEDDPTNPPPLGEKWPKSYRLRWITDTTYSAGNYQKIAGFTRLKLLNDSTVIPGRTDIIENLQGIRLITGLEKSGDDYKIFVKSSHPGFRVTEIEGAIIPRKGNPLFQKPGKWSWGLTFGPSVSIGGTITQPMPFIGMGACFGLQYNIKEF